MSRKEIARYISQKVVNEKDYSPITEFLTDDYVYHGLGGMTSQTPQGFMEAIKGFHAAIPDLKSEIIDMVDFPLIGGQNLMHAMAQFMG